MRDETYFGPHFFEHYRNLGFAHFVIYDDRSDEPFRSFLEGQPDCTLLRSDSRFEDQFGLKPDGTPRRLASFLKENLPKQILKDRWVLVVDADEFLVLPPGVSTIQAFTQILDAAGRTYATAPMVDCYGETLGHHDFDPALSPFAGNPFFDVGPYFRWEGRGTPKVFQAGIRHRLLSMLYREHQARVREIYSDKPKIAALWKVPLIKEGAGILRMGDHGINQAPDGILACALAHFKFYPGLAAKVETAVTEGQYYNGSVEYRFLQEAFKQMGDRSLIGPMTRRFTGPESLVEAGLLPLVGAD
ncbi:hypothetical protein CSW58_04010 [Caulobacter sp. B11]|uniref:glycosyltransferase family 2 protein n=1 Tax=Caulobacter sp. B11 TaxID=2048899 RepID=UPI000C12DE15|nr:glycosyltransferase family 2 protein [Caulobacter sp. B11]PHY13700.1 hypothetical protein CSW58_04010 [Caulobacter sp. B11]